MLDLVMELLPSPLDRDHVTGTHPDTGEELIRKPDYNEPFTALAFKIATDPYVGRLAFMRVYAGVLPAGSYVLNTRSGNKERISRIFQMHANKQNPIDQLGAGDIGAAVGFKDIRTGDTLCDENKPIVLEAMDFPEPVIGLAIEPKTQADMDKLGIALGKLSEEDPTFRVKTDEETGQTIISGMGELHLKSLLTVYVANLKLNVTRALLRLLIKKLLLLLLNTARFTRSSQVVVVNLPISLWRFLQLMKVNPASSSSTKLWVVQFHANLSLPYRKALNKCHAEWCIGRLPG